MGLYSKYCGSLWFISTGSCIVSWNVRSFGLSGCHQCHRFRRLWQCQSSTSKSRCSAKCRNCRLRFRIRSGNPIECTQNSMYWFIRPILPDLGNWICFFSFLFSTRFCGSLEALGGFQVERGQVINLRFLGMLSQHSRLNGVNVWIELFTFFKTCSLLHNLCHEICYVIDCITNLQPTQNPLESRSWAAKTESWQLIHSLLFHYVVRITHESTFFV